MNWLSEQYQRERHADDVRDAERNARVKALLEQDKDKQQGKGRNKKVRRAIGSKLIEWGEQLQDGRLAQPIDCKNLNLQQHISKML